jgi:xanthine dehydrogenase YagS FAD-binding subunit
MNPFRYQRAKSEDDAVLAIRTRGSKFLGGGTNLVDLMRYDVEKPSALIDVTGLNLTKIEDTRG